MDLPNPLRTAPISFFIPPSYLCLADLHLIFGGWDGRGVTFSRELSEKREFPSAKFAFAFESPSSFFFLLYPLPTPHSEPPLFFCKGEYVSAWAVIKKKFFWLNSYVGAFIYIFLPFFTEAAGIMNFVYSQFREICAN